MAVTCEGCQDKVDYYVVRFPKPGQKVELCRRCARGGSPNVSGVGFPFTTAHIGDDPRKPITVNSLYHLRKLEARHGVASAAYNLNERSMERR